MKRPSWNSKGAGADQVNFLLVEIEVLKAEHEITGASVVAHWTIHRVQPLQRRVHLAFEYTGEEDPTRYAREKISEDDLENRVAVLLKNINWRPSLSGAFRADRRPREVLLRVVDCSFKSSTFCRVVELIWYLSCRLIPKTIRVGLRCLKMCLWHILTHE